jgi:bloom syndrome protein
VLPQVPPISLLRLRHSNANVGVRQCGIVYCNSTNDCEKMATFLKSYARDQAAKTGKPRLWTVEAYHAKLDPQLRTKVQNDWSNDVTSVVCATIAFGMGINKPDVRFVVHFGLPKSLENYHQEAGRAGRDNRPAKCILYYAYGDYIKVRPRGWAKADRGDRGARGGVRRAVLWVSSYSRHSKAHGQPPAAKS